MQTNTDDTTEAQIPDQAEYVQQIETVEVDPDDVVKHYTRNLRNSNPTGYTPRSFELVGFRSDGQARIKIGVDPRDEGAYFDGSPYPVWVSPGRFVEGAGRGEDGGEHRDIGLPNETENRRILRSEVDAEEGTEAFERHHESAMETWREMWEKAIRSDLKDSIVFRFREMGDEPTIEHEVNVVWTDE